MEINDTLLDRFKLISQGMRQRRSDLGVMRTKLGDVNSSILQQSIIERDEDTGETFRTIQPTEQLAD